MMSIGYELISASDYDALPLDPESCFVELEAICERNMSRLIDENTSGSFDTIIRARYMATVAGSARECGIQEVISAYTRDDSYETFGRFLLVVHEAVARIRTRNRRSLSLVSVQLLPNTRTKIEHHILRLRDEIESSDLSRERKKVLFKRLDGLIIELSKPRLDFGKTFTVLSLVLAGLAAATTISADSPTAITNIMRLIGKDRETEEAAVERLAPPPKALPAPPASRRSIAPAWEPTKGNDLDDEIPF